MTKTELKEAKERYFMLSKMIQEATYKSLEKENEDQQKERVKRLLQPENYVEFFDYYFGVNSGLPLADAPSSKFHQSSYEDVFYDRKIRQFRMWFRGAAKSIHTNVGNILHLKQNDELFFALLIGANEGLAKILLSDLQMHLESNQRILKDFGTQLSYGNWADGEFQTKDGRFFKALGLNQPFRGLRFGQYRPDFASVDDCEDRDRAKNPAMIRKYGEKITGDLKKAFHKERGRLIVPNNYIVKEGLIDFMIEKFKDSKHFNMSKVDLATKNITVENCRKIKNWKPSWDERYTHQEVIDIIEDDDYYTSQREDFNNPIEEGKLFKAKDMIYTRIAENEVFDGLLDHWDLSYTGPGDYKAGVLIGIKGIKLFVLEVFCQKCEINSAMEVRSQWVKKYLKKGYNLLVFFDATAAQRVVYTPIILQSAEDNNCPNIPIPMHQEGDKHNRIAAGITNVLFRKILFWDESLKERCSDFALFMKLILAFEKGMATGDDPADTLERGITLSQTFFGFSKEETGSKPVIGERKKNRKV
ncbi:hypothetical protein BWK63_09635 [Flavobacterium covae]|uniref:Uncharacterized protein n=1 Tax=Flavobacterium covae TaxID=2906076 RepID=A0ABW8PJX3_9FLAO|nr:MULTISPECIES: hypothetical protein [Flavobacterium]OWP80717.1 hypothetical protein BWK63_09635 [Flavobacterium covae]POR21316.1 hypothetical protein BWK57_10575 [Flavobacterium columnare]